MSSGGCFIRIALQMPLGNTWLLRRSLICVAARRTRWRRAGEEIPMRLGSLKAPARSRKQSAEMLAAVPRKNELPPLSFRFYI